MKDIIYRQDAIKELESEKEKNAKGDIAVFYNKIIEKDIEKLRKLPSAHPEPKMGKWINPTLKMVMNRICGSAEVLCSACNTPAIDEYDFCPSCGAKMEKSEEKE